MRKTRHARGVMSSEAAAGRAMHWIEGDSRLRTTSRRALNAPTDAVTRSPGRACGQTHSRIPTGHDPGRINTQFHRR